MHINEAYKILKISEDQNLDEIKKTYHKLSLKTHPDKSGGNTEKMQLLNEAYNIILNYRQEKGFIDAIIKLLFEIKDEKMIFNQKICNNAIEFRLEIKKIYALYYGNDRISKDFFEKSINSVTNIINSDLYGTDNKKAKVLKVIHEENASAKYIIMYDGQQSNEELVYYFQQLFFK